MPSALEEVTAKCKTRQRHSKAQERLKRPHTYKTQLKVLGLNHPSLQAIFKEGFSFDTLSGEKRFRMWYEIWKKGRLHEVKSLAMMFFCGLREDELLAQQSPVEAMSDEVENWAHADSYASLVSRLLEYNPSVVRPWFEKWNNSANPWQRRLSVTGLYYYSSLRKKMPDTTMVLHHLRSLLGDKHYYVQKGVGWTLRELGNVSPRQHKAFLNRHLLEIHPLAFGAAVEKILKNQREVFKERRRCARKG